MSNYINCPGSFDFQNAQGHKQQLNDSFLSTVRQVTLNMKDWTADGNDAEITRGNAIIIKQIKLTRIDVSNKSRDSNYSVDGKKIKLHNSLQISVIKMIDDGKRKPYNYRK